MTTILASSAATSATIGLLICFLGIGVLVNVGIVYIIAQVLAERSENERFRRGS